MMFKCYFCIISCRQSSWCGCLCEWAWLLYPSSPIGDITHGLNVRVCVCVHVPTLPGQCILFYYCFVFIALLLLQYTEGSTGKSEHTFGDFFFLFVNGCEGAGLHFCNNFCCKVLQLACYFLLLWGFFAIWS